MYTIESNADMYMVHMWPVVVGYDRTVSEITLKKNSNKFKIEATMAGLYIDHNQCLQMLVPSNEHGNLLDIYGNSKVHDQVHAWCGKARILQGSMAQVNIEGRSDDTFVVVEDDSLTWDNEEKWFKVSYTMPQLWLLRGHPRRAPLMSLAFLKLLLIIFEQVAHLVVATLPIEFFCNVVYVPDSP